MLLRSNPIYVSFLTHNLEIDMNTDTQPKPHDPHHPYVLQMRGCGHGVLFRDYCRDCEIVSVQERYKTAIRTVQHCRNDLRRLGVSMPGEVAP